MQKLILIFILLFSNCDMFQTTGFQNANKNPSRISLKITPRLGSFFPAFQKLEYPENEINPLFANLRAESNSICKMLYKQETFNLKKVKSYTNLGFIGPVEEKIYDDTVKRIIAGCWNFYQMNDIKPERDFEHLKFILPDKKKNCFSVGFMQPYIMHSILDCETLTMLDMDWKILDGHSQILEGFKNNKFETETSGLKFIESLKLNWIVGKKFQAEPIVNIDDLCKDNNKLCINYLLNFQKKFNNLKEINLNLSTIHEANIKPQNGHISIIFVSNAFENYYTKPRNFEYMIQYLNSSLLENDSVYFIYHVGGRPSYGIYQIQKKNNQLEYSTICKDEYRYTPPKEDVEIYQIYFDYIKGMKKSKKACSSIQFTQNISEDKKIKNFQK
ncbi:MAG: hypothetical protein KDK36_17635 [Leptospiraceae bacterium]|nr:hypothetical protein [Leptospiraceae bacterium]